MNNCFYKTNRILKSGDFKFIKKMGCKKISPHFVLYYKNTDSLHSRIGLTVSKKNGNSVQRNKQKRIIREFFRKNKSNFKKNDFVLIVRKSIYNKTHFMIVNELNELFKIT